MKSHISFFDVVICAFAGLLVMSPIADGLDPRGIGIGAVFVGVAEVFVGIRHRMSLKCSRCGFDPIIYRKSQEKAAELVRLHLARRAENPANLLAEPVVAAGLRSSRSKKAQSRRVDPTQQL